MAEDVHKQLAADPILVRYLFGTTEYRGAVRVHDCEGQIPAQEEKDKPLKLTRNAIDRVTGSAAHGALYSELLYPHATWDSIQIDVVHPNSSEIFARTLVVSYFQPPRHQPRIMSFQASRSACKRLSFC